MSTSECMHWLHFRENSSTGSVGRFRSEGRQNVAPGRAAEGKKMPVLCAFFLSPCWGGCWLKSCSPESQDRPLSVPWSSSVHAHKHTRAILNACWLHCLFNIVTHFSHVPQFWNHLSGNKFYKNYLQFYCTQLMFLQWRFGYSLLVPPINNTHVFVNDESIIGMCLPAFASK